MTRLGDVLETLVDCEHKTAPTDDQGTHYAVGTPAMAGNRIDYEAARRISKETFSAWTRRLTPRFGDLLLAREAPVGPVVAIPRHENVAPGQRTVLMRPNARTDSRYLYYALTAPSAQQLLLEKASGSTVAHLNVADIRLFEFGWRFPPLPTQRAIAEVLGALDDKIAANASVIAVCDRLRSQVYSKALFAHTRPLSELARFVNGKAYTKGATGTGRVVIRIAELNSGLGGSTVYNDLEVPDDNTARPGDLLFAWSGSLTVARWFRPEAIVNQHIFKVIPNDPWPMWLVACAVEKKLEDFRAIAADKATTMGHIQRRHLDEPVAVPDIDTIGQIDESMSALWGRALAAEIESLKLAQLRDTLLPHLMSGRITVREAEQRVDEVL